MIVGTIRSLALIAGSLLLLAQVASAADGFDSRGQCVGDANNDGEVTIDEILVSVNNALANCQYVPVVLQFRGVVGELPFECGQEYHGIGTTNADIVPSDFRFYVHNVRLVTADDHEVEVLLDQDHIWQVDDIALLDFENKVRPCTNGTVPTNTTVHGRVAPGDYRGLRFTFGVPFARNHADASVAPSPLNLSGLFWSWQDGYKFIRVDTAFDNLRVHVGSTGCFYARPGVVGGCARPNRAEIRLDHFEAATNVVVADLAALLADSDVNSNQPDTAPGCMADPDDQDCVPILRNLGINFSDGSATPGTQKLFRVE
jgi:uncharacterized repeat protein (TIGR04052 family)